MPNFDETEKEPGVLPVRIPHLLINGAEGIAVGMSTSIPPHNLGEVIDASEGLYEESADDSGRAVARSCRDRISPLVELWSTKMNCPRSTRPAQERSRSVAVWKWKN